MELVASTLTLPRNVVYAALLPLMRTPRLPAVDLNGLVRFAERRNLVSARVPSHFNRSIIDLYQLQNLNIKDMLVCATEINISKLIILILLLLKTDQSVTSVPCSKRAGYMI